MALPVQETRVWSLNQKDLLEKENSNPLQYSCLENSMDRGAWWATVHGVAKELDVTQWLNNNTVDLQCCVSFYFLKWWRKDCSLTPGKKQSLPKHLCDKYLEPVIPGVKNSFLISSEEKLHHCQLLAQCIFCLLLWSEGKQMDHLLLAMKLFSPIPLYQRKSQLADSILEPQGKPLGKVRWSK